jgi:hypothetical protein
MEVGGKADPSEAKRSLLRFCPCLVNGTCGFATSQLLQRSEPVVVDLELGVVLLGDRGQRGELLRCSLGD